ncbi:2,3-diaminopropionate biosynthesis protein SbnB [Plantactinospora sp. KLBMP9567]|uniref:2,3-diaminopropionate biosynthesis protein SbnB n=1 Tax=Plantactinospora sp. KLBMP9567 TaxID=3085900 RepID=UPI002980CAA3|nr:2,3-diaminopropionate biosynthesis protein SbnB [Plantactinospora sp. KLBMP9567]MDW5329458.1 2,3-diaminopropionate biosynthesis protein SbnB [Plantactinospora sp. KLBMP9567]
MLILRYDDVQQILAERELALIELVGEAYKLHDEGATAVPHSIFLRFPDQPRNRIIGLPAYVGGNSPAAGMKWIASWPGNITTGLARASASILVNDLETGQPTALLEGSVISAKRTAASAALAARLLVREPGPSGVALIGCGVINLEVLRFLLAALPTLTEVTLFDNDCTRAAAFARNCADLSPTLHVTLAADAGRAVAAHDLVSIATTAAEPHLDLGPARPGTLVLHVSLRDLTPATILASQNVVDDADHVCREQTSLHLTEQQVGHRDFIDAPIGQILRGTGGFRRDPDRTVVFSPFGLGALDIALAEFVRAAAVERGLGIRVDDFLPATGGTAWHRESQVIPPASGGTANPR